MDDALQANRLIDNAEQAAKLLESFVAAQPKTPQTPDALLKLGHCYQRIGVLLLNAEEKRQTLQKVARRTTSASSSSATTPRSRRRSSSGAVPGRGR